MAESCGSGNNISISSISLCTCRSGHLQCVRRRELATLLSRVPNIGLAAMFIAS